MLLSKSISPDAPAIITTFLNAQASVNLKDKVGPCLWGWGAESRYALITSMKGGWAQPDTCIRGSGRGEDLGMYDILECT